MVNLWGLGRNVFCLETAGRSGSRKIKSSFSIARDIARRIAPMIDGPWRSFEMMQTAGDMVLHVDDVGGYYE
jgi:hypothetical protein